MGNGNKQYSVKISFYHDACVLEEYLYIFSITCCWCINFIRFNSVSNKHSTPPNLWKEILDTFTIKNSKLNELAVVIFSSSFYLIIKFVNTNNYITHYRVPMLYIYWQWVLLITSYGSALNYVSCHKIYMKSKFSLKFVLLSNLFHFICSQIAEIVSLIVQFLLLTLRSLI